MDIAGLEIVTIKTSRAEIGEIEIKVSSYNGAGDKALEVLKQFNSYDPHGLPAPTTDTPS
jgi:hypothetical protein